mgnify:CR=1 FL=1
MLDTTTVLTNFKKENISLSILSPAVANYVGYRIIGKTLIISGQLPMTDGKIVYEGVLGDAVDLDTGYQAARLCGINILAQANHAIGGEWSRIKQCVRLGGFVAATSDFKDHPKVMNGASDLMAAILGEMGRHARAAVGVSSLPLGACVEVEALFELI